MADTDSNNSDQLIEALRMHFGFDGFRPGQVDAIQSLLQGQHTLVVMPTGAGKSLVYQMAAMLTDGVTLVISPLISLMHDQVRALAKRRIPAAFINSALSQEDQAARLRAMENGRLKLVYVAPERLRTPQFREAISKVKVSLLAVDEAHCISHWGHDFRPDYLNIADSRRHMHYPVTAALTATATDRVRRDISWTLGMGATRQIVTGFNRPNLSFEVRSAQNHQAKAQTLVEIISGLEDGSAIVYTGSRRDSEELAGLISHITGRQAEFYHGRMEADARTDVTNRFLSGELPIVTATNAFGMGIDRADVRMVVHFSLPGSLEAYYQEAGRAGRDGKQSKAILIYSPKDTALHEYFIRSSIITREMLYNIYKILSEPNRAARWVDRAELSAQTGLDEVALRVAMSLLEETNAITVIGVVRGSSLIEYGEWKESSISMVLEKSGERLKIRREHLNNMVRYAETNECRRKSILHYFGDDAKPEASICCDNCIMPMDDKPDSSILLNDESKAALVILETVQKLRWPTGRTKLAQMLAGTKAKAMLQVGYAKQPFYGILSKYYRKDVMDIIDQLLRGGFLAMEGSDLPVVKLSRKGETALLSKQAIGITIRRASTPQRDRSIHTTNPTANTFQITADMFSRGMSVQQIADERGLVTDTIYGHLARQISAGNLSLEQVLREEDIKTIRTAVDRAGSDAAVKQIKSILGDAVGYGPIYCVLSAMGRGKQAKPASSSDKNLTDKVSEYLSGSHPRKMPGIWTSGWSLGFHSTFSGDEWKRSAVGDLVYRLKYCEDRGAINELVKLAVDICNNDSCFRATEVIIPMPGSVKRAFDHVSLFACTLASKTNKQALTALSKVRSTPPQKELTTLAQKHRNVARAFVCDGSVRGKNVLLVDDLYDSGATFTEAARVILAAGAKSVRILAMTSTIHSDA